MTTPTRSGFLLDAPAGAPKRERTRRQLLRAALAVLNRRGVAAFAAQEVAAAAGVANGTFYNYFPTREALLGALAGEFVESYSRHIDASYAHIEDGAERMAIGGRRYVLFAAESPDWARLMIGLMDGGAPLLQRIAPFALRDLRMGVRQKRFRIVSERAAMDLIAGTDLQAIRSVLSGTAGRAHAVATATTVLRGLGMDYDEAAEVARRPLPPLSVRLPEMPTTAAIPR
jgi:AcrR family transcriptional regulator